MLADDILKQCVAGKTFRTNQAIEVRDSEGKPVIAHGKPKVQYVPHVRPMKVSDVLHSYETDVQFVVISNDGSKYRIEKTDVKVKGQKPEQNQNPNTPPA
ncbi:MAG TPA: hypothetical protein PKN47_01625 [Nitrospira sp.]|nr:hypothetical protein [Nitrospira sp.]